MKKLNTCQECGKSYKRLSDLTKHISSKHYDKKLYYDKYVKKEKEGFCLECGKHTKFSSWSQGYNKFCQNNKCVKIGRVNEIEKTNIKKYGVSNVNKLESVRIKIKETNLARYGNFCPMQEEKRQSQIQKDNIDKFGFNYLFKSKEIQLKSALTREKRYGYKYTYQTPKLLEKISKTNLERYGIKNPILHSDVQAKLKKTNLEHYGNEYQIASKLTRNKIEQTNLKRYGNICSLQTPIIQKKSKKTNLMRYGVEYPMQNKELFEKTQKSAFKIKKYKDTDLWYQGSYELDFLDNYYDLYDIERGPSIKFKFDKKNKVYHSDFFIPFLNLIVECKNSYLAKRDEFKLKAKEIACIDQGYNWIMLIDKNYEKIKELI